MVTRRGLMEPTGGFRPLMMRLLKLNDTFASEVGDVWAPACAQEIRSRDNSDTTPDSPISLAPFGDRHPLTTSHSRSIFLLISPPTTFFTLHFTPHFTNSEASRLR